MEVTEPWTAVAGACSGAVARRQNPPESVVDRQFAPRITASPPARRSAAHGTADAEGAAVPKKPSGTLVGWPLVDGDLQEGGSAGCLHSERAAPATTRPCWSVAIHRADAGVVVSVRGQLKGATAAKLDHILRDLIHDQGNHRVIVDTEDVSEADANGVAVLVDAALLARTQQGAFVLVGPSPAIEDALDEWRGGDVVTDDIVARSAGDRR